MKKTKQPPATQTARSVLRRAAGSGEPDLGRLVEALPRKLAEARRRRAGQAPVEPLVAVLVAVGRRLVPRFAAAALMLVLAATFFGFRDTGTQSGSSADLDGYILTGEVSDGVSDLLLEALAEKGQNHG